DHVVNAISGYSRAYQWVGPRSATDSHCRYPWGMFYQFISNANILINGIDAATGKQADKDAIKGQSLFYRAFCYHRLVQAYADRYVPGAVNSQLGIPLMLSSTTEGQTRATVEAVYTQIHMDLDEAITLLGAFTRPNKSHIIADIARGIKARVYLTQGKFSEAANYAKQVITSGSYSLMDFATYATGFGDGSASDGEFIWASHIVPSQTDVFANFGAYITRNFSSKAIRGNPRSISGWLYNQISATDVRKGLFDDAAGEALTLPTGESLPSKFNRFPYTSEKFIVPSSSSSDSRIDVPHLRISEMYLIVAEANARMGGQDAAAAAALYSMAVVRDPSYTLSTRTGQALIDEIMIQRRVELWGEGFRWYDLKRLNEPLNRTQAGNHKASLALEMQIPAGDVKWTWLIPQSEIDANPAMVQNP
ncbi:RagB/SusD family nutrient uptake outer membrane protein, partial [bacterium]|nr:RagB/SusD family nutrient uptake outer membrane protein [bacterium]